MVVQRIQVEGCGAQGDIARFSVTEDMNCGNIACALYGICYLVNSAYIRIKDDHFHVRTYAGNKRLNVGNTGIDKGNFACV